MVWPTCLGTREPEALSTKNESAMVPSSSFLCRSENQFNPCQDFVLSRMGVIMSTMHVDCPCNLHTWTPPVAPKLSSCITAVLFDFDKGLLPDWFGAGTDLLNPPPLLLPVSEELPASDPDSLLCVSAGYARIIKQMSNCTQRMMTSNNENVLESHPPWPP